MSNYRRSLLLFLAIVYAAFASSNAIEVEEGSVETFSMPYYEDVRYIWYVNGVDQEVDNRTFEYLFDAAGEYTLSAQYETWEGCLSPATSMSIRVIEVPGHRPLTDIEPEIYFTPDGDGVNETWDIKGIEKYPTAVIEIYNRHHKLLVRYSGSDLGWDGMYNGHQMPSDDYWYYIKVEYKKPLSGHFTLKR